MTLPSWPFSSFMSLAEEQDDVHKQAWCHLPERHQWKVTETVFGVLMLSPAYSHMIFFPQAVK